MSFSLDLTFLYVFASVLIGSAMVTSLIKLVTIGLRPLLATKQGLVLSTLVDRISERLLTALSVSEPLIPADRSASSSSRGYLETLPQRSGPRPLITGTSNPKQTTHITGAEKDLPSRLRDVITTVNKTYPQTTYLGRSTFEGSNTTLFARHRVFNHTKYYGEILSADNLNGFMSTILHPSDVRTIIEKGWGQRHPLSSRPASWFLRLTRPCQPAPVAGSQVVLYAPHSQEDLEVVTQIVNAAVWWVGGVDTQTYDESCC